MGYNEWAIPIIASGASEAKIRFNEIKSLIESHNNQSYYARTKGQDLALYWIFRYKDHLYICCGNVGGREATTEFIKSRAPKWAVDNIFFPYETPIGWHENRELVWESSSCIAVPTSIFELYNNL